MYHVTTWKNWLNIQEHGLVPQLLPAELWDAFPSKQATYLGVDIALVEGFLEGYLYDMFPDENEFALLEVNVPSGIRTIPDPEMGLDDEGKPYAYAVLDIIPAECVILLRKETVS